VEATKREVSEMRFLLGIIVGAALTILTAYVVDNRASVIGVETTTTTQKMVNWDIVSQNWQQFSDRVRGEWRRLTTS
jgi:hypothetical protein